MKEKLKINPKEVEFDGHSFRLIIPDREALIDQLKKKSDEIYEDLVKRAPLDDDEENLISQDAHVTEEERWEELCSISSQP